MMMRHKFIAPPFSFYWHLGDVITRCGTSFNVHECSADFELLRINMDCFKLAEIYSIKFYAIINTLHMDFQMMLDKLHESYEVKTKVVEEREATRDRLGIKRAPYRP